MRTARIFKRIDLPQGWLLLCLWLTITQACLRWPTKKSKVPKHNVMLSNFRLLEQHWEEIINKNISIHFKLKRNVGPGLHRRRLPRHLHQRLPQAPSWSMVFNCRKDKGSFGFNQNSFSSCRCGERKVVRTRIVGGQNAQKNEYPWQVDNNKKSYQIIRNLFVPEKNQE